MPTNRLVARKQVNGRLRCCMSNVIHLNFLDDPDSPACMRVRPKRKAHVVNRNALLAHFRPLDSARRRSDPGVIELIDSGRGRGPCCTGAVIGSSTIMSKACEDLMVISSGSEGNSPCWPARVGRRSAPIIHKAKKAHSTVSRRVSDFIAILDSDDDGPAAMSSFTEEHRQPTTTALSVSITIVGILPEGSLQLRCLTLVTASPLRMRQKILTPMAQRLATTSTLAPAVLHQGPDVDDILHRPFGDIDLDLSNANNDMADTNMNMDVDGWNSTTKARKERRGVKDVQVDADLAAEEYGGNKNGRKNPQDSPGSKTITCSSIKSSNKVRIASYELCNGTSGAENPPQTSTSSLAALSVSSAKSIPGRMTTEATSSTTTKEIEAPLSAFWIQEFHSSILGARPVTFRATLGCPTPNQVSQTTITIDVCHPRRTITLDHFLHTNLPTMHISTSFAKVAHRKNKVPAFQSEEKLMQTTSQPLVSDEVDPPLTPSQSLGISRAETLSGSPSDFWGIPFIYSLRLPKPVSEPSLCATRSVVMEPSLHVPVDIPSVATTTTTTSTSFTTPHTTSPVCLRCVPVSFEEFISKSPATKRSPLTQMRSAGSFPSQRSPRWFISVSFEKFIVNTARTSPSFAAPVASMPPPSQFDDVTGEATKDSQRPQRNGSQNNCIVKDETSVEVPPPRWP
ncbi:hypothetical protein BKA82DRAFT_32841 [Pisolithus tinctorius]|uniref:Uncharacterized protein n=1 Tax=Pisolithus tinctorius Marx 270 TaxID=870435 RepID=A0A0C3NNL5_PISTI|nr:hypothetical protein BKA82DRAFT_32841 [Pisolithus tinctorius]KIN96878.1 hypothetical protein M404DRAFT_32841 [Pisolithus tinctorius Marx 270]